MIVETNSASEFLEALKDFIDARLEEEFSRREEGADGYFSAPVREREAREIAWVRLSRTIPACLPAAASFFLSTDAEYREMALKFNKYYRVLSIDGNDCGVCLISVQEAYRQKRDSVDTIPLNLVLESLAPDDRAYVVAQ